MYRYVFAPLVILSSILITSVIEPFWQSYIEYTDQIENSILRSVIVKVIIPWFLSTSVYWSMGILFLLVDKYHLPKSLYETKYQKKVKNSVTLTDCVKQVIFNQLFALLPGMLILNLIGNVQVSAEIPNLFTITLHLLLTSFCGEIFYYISHRILHIKPLYVRIHKRHHNYKAPIAIVSLYAHPLEVLFGNTFALIGPIYLLGVHAYTLYLGLILGFIDSLSDHAGYDVKNKFHDLHHQRTNYNFGSMGILDRLFGTYCDN